MVAGCRSEIPPVHPVVIFDCAPGFQASADRPRTHHFARRHTGASRRSLTACVEFALGLGVPDEFLLFLSPLEELAALAIQPVGLAL